MRVPITGMWAGTRVRQGLSGPLLSVSLEPASAGVSSETWFRMSLGACSQDALSSARAILQPLGPVLLSGVQPYSRLSCCVGSCPFPRAPAPVLWRLPAASQRGGLSPRSGTSTPGVAPGASLQLVFGWRASFSCFVCRCLRGTHFSPPGVAPRGHHAADEEVHGAGLGGYLPEEATQPVSIGPGARPALDSGPPQPLLRCPHVCLPSDQRLVNPECRGQAHRWRQRPHWS